MVNSAIGLILLDSMKRPVYLCNIAEQILSGYIAADATAAAPEVLAERVAALLDQVNGAPLETSIHVTLETREYDLRQVSMVPVSGDHGPMVAVLLQPTLSTAPDLKAIAATYKLTPREKQVLALVLKGLSPKEIGGELGISSSTAKTFVRILITKVGVSGRPELIAKLLGL